MILNENGDINASWLENKVRNEIEGIMTKIQDKDECNIQQCIENTDIILRLIYNELKHVSVCGNDRHVLVKLTIIHVGVGCKDMCCVIQ